MTTQKKTKIFCTMGPACWDVPTLLTLIDAGMNTARLNFSHGDHKAHGETLQRVREAATRHAVAKRPSMPPPTCDEEKVEALVEEYRTDADFCEESEFAKQYAAPVQEELEFDSDEVVLDA